MVLQFNVIFQLQSRVCCSCRTLAFSQPSQVMNVHARQGTRDDLSVLLPNASESLVINSATAAGLPPSSHPHLDPVLTAFGPSSGPHQAFNNQLFKNSSNSEPLKRFKSSGRKFDRGPRESQSPNRYRGRSNVSSKKAQSSRTNSSYTRGSSTKPFRPTQVSEINVFAPNTPESVRLMWLCLTNSAY